VLARIEAAALASLERAGRRPADPTVLRFLLTLHAADDSSRAGARLESALGVAVERYRDAATARDRARWLRLFVDVSTVADDERVRAAVEELSARLAGEWPALGDAEAAAGSIDACLLAGSALERSALLSAAVDELERLVGRVYRPGQPLGSAGEHVRLASALLTAFAITGRIPYAMLAEEEVQTARRAWWRSDRGAFDAPFDVNCDAAGVLRRLGALHRDPQYIARAIVSSDANYERDADRILAALERQLPPDDVVGAAAYGLVLLDREAPRFR
jgi:uncharacterized protein YyaL (SSP411 family)